MSGSRRVFYLGVCVCLVLQGASATWLVPSVESPNAADSIALNLAQNGRFEGGGWERLRGPETGLPHEPLRFFHLPGEPLYLAFWFRFLPESTYRYAHVPVTVGLISAVALSAARLGGWLLALSTLLVGAFQPFILVHGPVWDDTFLAAALLWSAMAILLSSLRPDAKRAETSRLKKVKMLMLLALFSGFAGITRLQTALILAAVTAVVFLRPQLRMLRPEAGVMGLSIIVALGVWGLRNSQAVGQFTISSSHDGITLLESNAAHTREALRYGQVERMNSADTMGVHWRRVAEMTELETNQYYRREALRYIFSNPFVVARTALLKVGISLLGVRPELSLLSTRNVVAVISQVVLALLAIPGLLWLRQLVQPPQAPLAFAIFAAITAVVALMLLIGPIGLRYKVTLDGVLWIAAGATIWRTSESAALWWRSLRVT